MFRARRYALLELTVSGAVEAQDAEVFPFEDGDGSAATTIARRSSGRVINRFGASDAFWLRFSKA